MNYQLAKCSMKAGLLIVMTLTLLSVSVSAQSLQQRIKVNIPFVFNVGDKEFQAGEYVVQRALPDNGDLVVRLSSLDGKSSAIRLTFPVLSLGLTNNGKLVFTRYGAHYFLSEVWPSGSNSGRGFPKSRIEREIAKDYPFEISSASARTTVVVEAR